MSKIAVALCVVVLSASAHLFAQRAGGREVEIKIYFPYDVWQIDSAYMDNPTTLRLIDSLLRDTLYISTLQTIEISAQSSLEGAIGYNRRLSERRRDVLQEYFTEAYPQIDSTLWSFKAEPENWELFRQAVEEDQEVPERERVLEIVDNDRDLDSKEWLLRTLNGGQTWSYLRENILPSQRFGASMLFIPVVAIAKAPQFESRFVESAIPHCYSPAPESELIVAIKTNMILDALSVVNVGVEIPIGERWSVVGEVAHPWWRSWPADFTMQIESYHGEAKYWLGDRATKEQLQGWSVGAYGGWARYDIQPFSSSGVQGEVFDIGAHVGYSRSIAKNLNLEFTLGLGYTSTDYEEYEMVSDTDEYGDIKVIPYPWTKESLRSILPTRCGVSLVWLIRKERGAKR
ncbi:MAG: DUF3575 domain-containing protein [Rikenellaceae bacterium]